MHIRGRIHALLTGLSALAAVVSLAVLFAMRAGLVAANPGRFAIVAALVLAFAAVALVAAILARAVPAALFSAGLLLVYGGGMANFLYGLQGYALLTELDAIRLAHGAALQGFETGPLSDLNEMNLAMQLEKLELRPSNGAFVPVSRVRLVRKGKDANVVEVSQSDGATDGTLRFVQGAFGFAPRIVVTRNGAAVFDRYVPFTTRRIDDQGVIFEETFEIGAERMTVRGALDLGSMDERMKGHARLGLAVSRDGNALGAGDLAIGHFAKLGDGSYIGYAGLKRWSEIDISRRNYPQSIYAGTALILLGGVLVPFMRSRP